MKRFFPKQFFFYFLLAVVLGIFGSKTRCFQPEASAQGVSQAVGREKLKVTMDPRVGTPLLVSVPDVQTQVIELKGLAQTASLEEKAKGFLKEYADLYQIEDPEKEFKTYKILENQNLPGNSHVKIGQRKNGLRVFGAELIAHFKDGGLTSVSGVYVPDITENPVPDLGQEAAFEIVKEDFELNHKDLVELEDSLQEATDEGVVAEPRVELVYFNKGLIENRKTDTLLAWDVSLTTMRYFVDAHTGEILFSYSLINEARDRNVFAAVPPANFPIVRIMDETGFVPWYPLGRWPDIDDDANDAYLFTGQAYNYYFFTFGRDSYDNQGSMIKSTVNMEPFGNFVCPQALWDPQRERIFFCDEMSDANDQVVHEYTHGVTQFSVGENEEGLIYAAQSGALNESYSDVFGAMVDRDDWDYGEDLYFEDPVRSLADPHLYADQPDHMSDHERYIEYEPPCDWTNDFCGVHTNSGVPNKVAYLLGEPGAHEHYGITVNGICPPETPELCRDKVEQIYYNTLTNYLYPTSNFYAASVFTEQSCRELIGQYGIIPGDCDEVHKAFQAVGINTLIQEFLGESGGDEFGTSVKNAGDVNGDGFDDIIVGAPKRGEFGELTGKAYIYLGGPFVSNDPYLELLPDSNDYRNFFGLSVSGAGDIDNDEFDDVIIGAYNDDNEGGVNTGAAYIFRGGDPMDAEPDVKLYGESKDDNFGFSVSGAGDVNNDGFDDVIVGAVWNAANGRSKAGKAYVFRGGNPMDRVADVVMNGENANDWFGWSVHNAGDVDNDGYGDVLVGARYHDGNGVDSGAAYLFLGDPEMNGESDVKMVGEAPNNYFGESNNTLGDVNGDNYDDIIVGAYLYGSSAGKAYIYFGAPESELDAIPDRQITGEKAGDQFGYSLSGGDVNQDTYNDVIIGAVTYNGESGPGKVYTYFGGEDMDITADRVILGEIGGDRFGGAVSASGDINYDGYADILVGAYSNDEIGTNAGKAYVFAGY